MNINALCDMRDTHHSHPALAILKNFCTQPIARQQAQTLVVKLTQEILNTFFTKNHLQAKSQLLIPILRAGLPMWIAANEFFNSPESSFIAGERLKGTDEIKINWLSMPELAAKDIYLLDTILATGRTLEKIACHIKSISQPNAINIISCYASPESLDYLNASKYFENIYVGVIAESVDEHGHLVPYTQGDSGDKLFGKRCAN